MSFGWITMKYVLQHIHIPVRGRSTDIISVWYDFPADESLNMETVTPSSHQSGRITAVSLIKLLAWLHTRVPAWPSTSHLSQSNLFEPRCCQLLKSVPWSTFSPLLSAVISPSDGRSQPPPAFTSSVSRFQLSGELTSSHQRRGSAICLIFTLSSPPGTYFCSYVSWLLAWNYIQLVWFTQILHLSLSFLSSCRHYSQWRSFRFHQGLAVFVGRCGFPSCHGDGRSIITWSKYCPKLGGQFGNDSERFTSNAREGLWSKMGYNPLVTSHVSAINKMLIQNINVLLFKRKTAALL